MPELPEVETIRRQILPVVKNRTITGIDIADPRNIKKISPKKFKQILINDKILDVERRAKYLFFKLQSGNWMVAHLGMAGRILINPDKYVRVTFNLSGGKKLYFSDTRMFGKLWLYNKYPELDLGQEPLDPQFTVAKLKEMLSRKRGNVKVVLMDQSFIAGVGNIYAQEALFLAKINPKRRVETLSDSEIKELHKAIIKVLEIGIAHKGSSVDNFVDATGQPGQNQDFLNVYDRKGEPCKRCKGTIQKLSVGQRGTYFCPSCQK